MKESTIDSERHGPYNTTVASKARYALPVAGLLLASLAAGVSVRAWLAERAFIKGRAAQARGDINSAATSYRVAMARGDEAAARALARLSILRRDWAGAESAVRGALALAPSRAYAQVLRARLEALRPDTADAGRDQRVLEACRAAVTLEPGNAAVWRECGGLSLALAVRRRFVLDAARVRALLVESMQDYGEALRREPQSALQLFSEILDAGGDTDLVLDVASRPGTAPPLTVAVDLLLQRGLWKRAEPGYWKIAAVRGAGATFATAAAAALDRRGMVRRSD